MARWVVLHYASIANQGVPFDSNNIIAFLSTLLVFSVCITMLLALCGGRSHPLNVLNARADYSSDARVCDSLAIAPQEEFQRQEKQELNNFRILRSSGNSVIPSKLSSAGAAINKLGSSFRISSFRDPAASFRNSSFRNSPFRISSFKLDSCKQVDGLGDSLRRYRPEGVEEEEESEEPAVWQKTILRGERCAPLSFSGLISYDVHGNLLPGSFRADGKESMLHKKQLAPGGSELQREY